MGPEERAVKKSLYSVDIVYLQLTGFLLELLFFATKIYIFKSFKMQRKERPLT